MRGQQGRRPVEQWAEALGLAWALGTASYSATYFVLYTLGLSVAAAIAPALAVAVLVSGAGLRVLATARRRETAPRSGSRVAIAAGSGLALIQTIVAAWIAVHSLLRHDDAWTVWAFKARLFALGGLPRGYFHSHVWSSHPDYPLNLPLVEALFFRLPDPAGLTLAALVGTASLAALLLLCYAGMARLYGRDSAALAAGALALVPSLSRFAGLGYADVPLALYAGAATLYLALWWRVRRPTDLVLCGLLAGCAAWTKHEGLAVAVLILLALAVEESGRRTVRRAERWRHIGVAVGAALAIPLPWLLFSLVERPVGSDFLPLTPAVLVHNAGRLPQTVLMFVQEALKVERWSLFWIILAVAVALAVPRLSRHGRALLVLLLAQLGLYLASYIFSDWVPFTLHVDSSLNRLMIQPVPLALLVAVEATRALTSARGSRSTAFRRANRAARRTAA